jgi:transcriptional regulator with XRE-family HTH domain
MTKLAAWMASQNLTDGEMADKVGWSRTQILRVRNGTSVPSRKLAKALETVTGIPAWDFIDPSEAVVTVNHP